VHERAAGHAVVRARDGDGDYLAHDDAVIAAIVDRGGDALEDGEGVVEDRGAGDGARVVGQALQLAL